MTSGVVSDEELLNRLAYLKLANLEDAIMTVAHTAWMGCRLDKQILKFFGLEVTPGNYDRLQHLAKEFAGVYTPGMGVGYGHAGDRLMKLIGAPDEPRTDERITGQHDVGATS